MGEERGCHPSPGLGSPYAKASRDWSLAPKPSQPSHKATAGLVDTALEPLRGLSMPDPIGSDYVFPGGLRVSSYALRATADRSSAARCAAGLWIILFGRFYGLGGRWESILSGLQPGLEERGNLCQGTGGRSAGC